MKRKSFIFSLSLFSFSCEDSPEQFQDTEVCSETGDEIQEEINWGTPFCCRNESPCRCWAKPNNDCTHCFPIKK